MDAWALHVDRYLLAFLQNDRQGMDKEVLWAKGKPEVVDFMLIDQSETEAYYGRLRKADEFSQQAIEAATQAKASERGAGYKAAAALRVARVGETTRARELAQQAMSLNPDPEARQTAAQALAQAADATRALGIAQQLNQQFPLSTLPQGCRLPAIRAAVYMQQGKPDSAIEEIERAKPRDPRFSDPCGIETAYVRGEAYLQARQPQQAVGQFRKILERPGLVVNSIIGPLARLQLGRAQAMMGDTAAARKSYQDFLTLWKDADPDVPIYQQAKAEYARLRVN